jgi:hypothetical protein
MAHFCRDLRHRQVLLLRKEPEEKILREGDLAPGQFLRQIHQEATLQDREDIRQLLAIASDLAVASTGSHDYFESQM